MYKEQYYDATTTHAVNLINAYHTFQYPSEPWKSLDNTLECDTLIYECTAHIRENNRLATEIQFSIDDMASRLQSHISKLLLGNSFTRINKQRLQPMLIGCFDFEGSRHRGTSDRYQHPHMHAILVLHKNTKDRFSQITSPCPSDRLMLNRKPQEFSKITFGQMCKKEEHLKGVAGLKRFADYMLKADKANEKSGNNIFTMNCYPKNALWSQHLTNLSASDLQTYN